MLGAAFLSAGLSKTLDVDALGLTLQRLGAPRNARALAVAVVASELLAAVALLVEPAAGWPRAVVAGLAVGFCAAGLKALASGKAISCNCFGSGGERRLGWRQVWLLPAWLLLAAVAQWQPPAWERSTGLLGLTAIALGLTAFRLRRSLPSWLRLRGDRIAILPSYPTPAQADTIEER